MKKEWVILTILVSCLSGCACAEEKLFWHPVRLDESGKLLAWSDSRSPYDEVVSRAWDAFKAIPVQPNGYKTYFAYPVFYGPKDTGQELFAGRDWTHNPGGLFAMLTDAAMLYYPYSGDEEIIPLIREMLDHFIAHGTTNQTDAWSLVPYASADGGSLEYRGATDTHYVQDEKYPGRGMALDSWNRIKSASWGWPTCGFTNSVWMKNISLPLNTVPMHSPSISEPVIKVIHRGLFGWMP